MRIVYQRVYFWEKQNTGIGRRDLCKQLINGVCGLHVIHLCIKSGIIMYNTNLYNVKHIPQPKITQVISCILKRLNTLYMEIFLAESLGCLREYSKMSYAVWILLQDSVYLRRNQIWQKMPVYIHVYVNLFFTKCSFSFKISLKMYAYFLNVLF